MAVLCRDELIVHVELDRDITAILVPNFYSNRLELIGRGIRHVLCHDFGRGLGTRKLVILWLEVTSLHNAHIEGVKRYVSRACQWSLDNDYYTLFTYGDKYSRPFHSARSISGGHVSAPLSQNAGHVPRPVGALNSAWIFQPDPWGTVKGCAECTAPDR